MALFGFGRGKEKKMVQKPVYVINGFLDSGKTSFFSYTIAQPYFQTSGTTLLIVCEEGEVEYSERLLRQTNTEIEVFENEEDLTPSAMMALEAKYRPERILIEYNGMWDFRKFRLPRAWRLEQQITSIDASTFSMYFTNMRSLLAEQIRNSELIMLNRCDGIDEKTLISYKRNIKAINQKEEGGEGLADEFIEKYALREAAGQNAGQTQIKDSAETAEAGAGAEAAEGSAETAEAGEDSEEKAETEDDRTAVTGTAETTGSKGEEEVSPDEI